MQSSVKVDSRLCSAQYSPQKLVYRLALVVFEYGGHECSLYPLFDRVIHRTSTVWEAV